MADRRYRHVALSTDTFFFVVNVIFTILASIE